MAVLIRDAEVEHLIRELSIRTGEAITEAVRISIAERLARMSPNEQEIARRRRRLREITNYFDALPRQQAADEDIEENLV
ncbi:type II toxin-antitoxin system VapB family antitoxin [Enterovirga rhinocerotis]|uniref:Putative transcription factor n=1 Tax=Enterovirga rhinocerotis TaxID=1339210 RepID=A0A4R7C7D3_9HYPH|nr:type II toxin-antitoxin system VapB family antitoxin [Enterovirga rhinocerotis]TDR93882.1 putative transcription factor [Enterovirga rhinocerotis]